MAKRISFLFLVCVLLQSCTFRKVAYRWADTYFYMQTNDAFELTHVQKAVVKTKIKSLLEWHRTHELPRYEKFVEQIAERTKGKLTNADMDWAYAQIVQFGDAIAHRLAPDGSRFILTLSDEQFDALAQNNAKRNKKRFEKYFSGEKKFIQLRTKDALKHTNQWLGSANSKQVSLIQAYAHQAWTFEKLRYENALNNQRDFLGVLRRRQPSEIQRRFENTFAFPQPYQTPAYQQAYQQNRQRIAQLLLDLYAHATPAQRDHFQKQLTELRADLVDMQKTSFL